jgi:hypothetical protein
MSKVPGYRSAVGYWGGNIRQRIAADQTPQKVLAWTQDKILAMGMPVALYEEVGPINGTIVQCSCFKDTSKQSDIRCRSCYGIKRVPGYQRFGMKYVWAASITPGWAYANCQLSQVNQPNTIELVDGQTDGTAISTQFAVDQSAIKGNFQYDFAGFARQTGNTITLEFSSTALSGTPVWQPISNLTALSQLPFPYLQFRVTFHRGAITDKSPKFEIVRVRWPTFVDKVPLTQGGLNEPVIRILETWEQETPMRTDQGRRLDEPGQTFFTTPMTFFDSTRVGASAAIVDNSFIEKLYSLEANSRYHIYNFKYSEQFGIFTRQQFEIRKTQGVAGGVAGEIYAQVF